MKLWTKFRSTYPIRLYQFVAIVSAITMTWAVGIWGASRYFSDRAADAARATAQASYENARDTSNQCRQRVATRADLRDVFIGIYDALDENVRTDNGHQFVSNLRATLDEKYPPLSVSDCPPLPVNPGG